jgi:hypothetical protein
MSVRVAETFESLILGLVGGVLLAALASVIGNTPLGRVVPLVIGGAVGWLAGRLGAAVVGVFVGVMVSALALVASDSPLAVILTVAGCVLLAVWCKGNPACREAVCKLGGHDGTECVDPVHDPARAGHPGRPVRLRDGLREGVGRPSS